MNISKTMPGKHFIVNSQKYIHVQTIGEGAQGSVYKVMRDDNNQQYALKTVPRSRYEEFNKMNDQEVEIMKKLSLINCPCIIKLIDHQKTNVENMLVMQLGEYSLAARKELFENTLNDRQIKLLIKNILFALKTVHQINIIHRDIKPHNIIVNTNDTKYPYKLTDFGVSAGRNATKCTYIGTEPYMAPEVLSSKNVDNKYTEVADIWSFAVVVFEAYFGFNPFVLKKTTRFQEQVRLIDELSENGFKFKKLLQVLDESNLLKLSSEYAKKVDNAPKQLLDFIGKGLHRNPSERISLSQIQSIIKSWEKDNEEKDPMKQNYRQQPTSIPFFRSEPFCSIHKPRYPTANLNLATTKVSLKTPGVDIQQPMPFVYSSNYQPGNNSSFHEEQIISQGVGRSNASSMSMNSSMNIQTTPIKKTETTSTKLSLTMVKHPSDPLNGSQQKTNNVAKTLNQKSSKNVVIEKSNFKEIVVKKLINLVGIIRQLKDNDFFQITKVAVDHLNQKDYDQNLACKQALLSVYHKLYRLQTDNRQFLESKKKSSQYVVQFLYEILILSHLSTLFNNAPGTFRGMPSEVSSLVFDPCNFLKFNCSKQMLRQFQWRFLSKTS